MSPTRRREHRSVTAPNADGWMDERIISVSQRPRANIVYSKPTSGIHEMYLGIMTSQFKSGHVSQAGKQAIKQSSKPSSSLAREHRQASTHSDSWGNALACPPCPTPNLAQLTPFSPFSLERAQHSRVGTVTCGQGHGPCWQMSDTIGK